MSQIDPANGYQVRPRDEAFLGYGRAQVGWWSRGEAPLGMTPAQFHSFRASLLEALRRDGISPENVVAELRGSSVNLFSNVRKQLPTAAELADRPEVAARLQEWLGDDPDRPRSRMFDAMYRLGLEQPSDLDLTIRSDEMARRALDRYVVQPPAGLAGPVHEKYEFVTRALMNETFPSVADWADQWHDALGRDVTPAVFGLQQELIEPVDIDPGVRWELVGPRAAPLPATTPLTVAPPEHAALRSNQQSGIDRALLEFLDSEVNLPDAAYRLLGDRTASIQQEFREDRVFSSNQNRLIGQGSCFYGTAIKPVAGRGLDADVLLEMPYRADWSPRRYLAEAERALNDSTSCPGTAVRQSRNVRVDFDETVHVDVIPLVTLPSGEQAIVHYEEDAFQPVDPAGIADWIDEQDDRSGGSLRPIVRLMKYEQAMNKNLPCAPIMMTILLGEQIKSSAEISQQSGLTHDLRHLVDDLCEATASAEEKPRIADPSRPDVNFDHRWKWGDYQQFRVGIRVYRDNLTHALETDPEASRPEVWAPVFGKNFADFLSTKAGTADVTPAKATPQQDSDLLAAAHKALSGSAPASEALRQSPANEARRSPAARREGARDKGLG